MMPATLAMFGALARFTADFLAGFFLAGFFATFFFAVFLAGFFLTAFFAVFFLTAFFLAVFFFAVFFFTAFFAVFFLGALRRLVAIDDKGSRWWVPRQPQHQFGRDIAVHLP
jgi:hypothetical protein